MSSNVTLQRWMTRCLPALAGAVLVSISSTASGAPCTKVVNAGDSIQAVVNTASAGDVICVRGGVYRQNNVWVAASGTADNPLVITAYPNELPILDAEGMTTPEWATFFTLNGSYVHLSGFEIRNGRSKGAKGVWLRGEHNVVEGMKVDNIGGQGILVTGDYNTVENCTIARAAMENLNCAQCSPAGWGFGLGSYLNYTENITVKGMVLRGNTIHDSWGEGLQTFQSTGAVIERNVSYDNFSTNFYIVASYGAVFRNNLGYNTATTAGRRPDGLLIADEQPVMPVSSKNTVINNLFFNADLVAYSWTITPNTGLREVLIANNTIINGALLTGAGGSSNITNANSSIRNNIIYRNDNGNTGAVPSSEGLTFSNNLWYPTQPANARGAGDVVGEDPLLAKTGAIGAGQLTAAYFRIRAATSPAIGAGAVLSAVPQDFFGTVRGAHPDIGAHQFDGGNGAPPDAGSGAPPDAGSAAPPDGGGGEAPDAGGGEAPDAGDGESGTAAAVVGSGCGCSSTTGGAWLLLLLLQRRARSRAPRGRAADFLL
jgi:hypothetical protein